MREIHRNLISLSVVVVGAAFILIGALRGEAAVVLRQGGQRMSGVYRNWLSENQDVRLSG